MRQLPRALRGLGNAEWRAYWKTRTRRQDSQGQRRAVPPRTPPLQIERRFELDARTVGVEGSAVRSVVGPRAAQVLTLGEAAYSLVAFNVLPSATVVGGRILHPDDRESAGEAWMRALATHTIYEAEFRIRRLDGVYRWFLARAEPVRTPDGSVTAQFEHPVVITHGSPLVLTASAA